MSLSAEAGATSATTAPLKSGGFAGGTGGPDRRIRHINGRGVARGGPNATSARLPVLMLPP
jgi:hypothetical protein